MIFSNKLLIHPYLCTHRIDCVQINLKKVSGDRTTTKHTFIEFTKVRCHNFLMLETQNNEGPICVSRFIACEHHFMQC